MKWPLSNIYTTNRFYWILGALAAVIACGFAWPVFLYLGQIGLIVFVALVISDLLLLFRSSTQIKAERKSGQVFSLSDENPVHIDLRSTAQIPLQILLIDELPYQLQRRDFEVRFDLQPRGMKTIDYTVSVFAMPGTPSIKTCPPYQWNYFMPEFIESKGNAEILGTIKTKNLSNFIRIPCGHGYFYLYSTPITFTNFYLLKEERMEYTSKVLSYLKPGDIIYDTYSNSAPREKPNNSEQEEGPLRFILSNTALRTAWYTLLATLLLFILFRAKRMQRSIPVLEPNENRSLEFVQTIGRMYFLQRNHKQLAQQKMRLFQHFIQERYQIPAANLTDEHFLQKLHLKSEVGMQTIQDILKQFKYIENTNEVTANDIINLHQALDYFYSHCK